MGRINFQFTIFIANSLSIYYILHELTFNSQSFARVHFKSTIFCANSIWIHYLSHELRINSLSSREFNFNLLFWARIYYVLTIVFAINFEFSIFGAFHFKSTVILSNNFSIHFLFREFTWNSLPFSRIQFQSTILCANSISIHFL